jgi:hypothetical protein
LVASDILGVSLFFVSTIWHDFIEFYFGLDFNRTAVFAFGVLLCAGSTFVRIARAPTGVLQKCRIPLALLVYFTLCLSGHLLAGEPIGQNLTFIVAPLVAVAMLSMDRRIVVAFLMATLAVCVLFEMVEFLTCKYFYVFDNGTYKLDELLYSGSTRSFRAKGLFSSPLSGNYVAMPAILLSGLSLRMIALSSMAGILAISKGAIVSNTALLALRLFVPEHRIRSLVVAGLAAVFLLGVAQLTRSFVCAWPSTLALVAPYKRVPAPPVDQSAPADHSAPAPEKKAVTAAPAVDQSAAATAPAAIPGTVPPPSKEEYEIPREVGRAKLIERINRREFNIAEFLGTAFDPSASTTSFRFFVWEQNLSYFLNFDAPHMLFGWPNFAYQVDIQGTESSVIKELQDYGIVGSCSR